MKRKLLAGGDKEKIPTTEHGRQVYLSCDEYIRSRILLNLGSDNYIDRSELLELSRKYGIDGAEKMKKGELYDALVEKGLRPEWFAGEYGIGVCSKTYQVAFDISHTEVKKAERKGLLTAVGYQRFYAYGKVLKTPLYDLFQFLKMDTWVLEP